MSPNAYRVLILAAVLCGGCALQQAAPARPVAFNAYRAGTLGAVRTVGIVPFAGNAATPETVQTFMDVFIVELQRMGRFHVAVTREAAHRLAPPAGILPDAPLTIESLIQARRQSGLDAVIVGQITQHRPYGSPVIGLDARMVSCRTGEVEWFVSAVFDSSRPDVIERLKDYTRFDQAEGEARGAWRELLTSPRRYAQFVAHELVATLADHESGGPARIAQEGPTERFFSWVKALPDQ